ncbi:hypothetical protein P4S72_19600 [Vibrio sp. PP-XX7]
MDIPARQRHRDALIAEVFIQVGLDHPHQLLRLYPFELSGGMLQRIMIALALLSGAPFCSPMNRRPTSIWSLRPRCYIFLEQQVRQQQRGLLLVTHDMGVVARLADDVAVIEQGKIIETGPVETIFYHPQHPITQDLIQAHLDLYPHLEQPLDRPPQLDLPHRPVSTLTIDELSVDKLSVDELFVDELCVDELSINKRIVAERIVEERIVAERVMEENAC